MKLTGMSLASFGAAFALSAALAQTGPTGLSADQRTEVIEGLREGDQVIVPLGFVK